MEIKNRALELVYQKITCREIEQSRNQSNAERDRSTKKSTKRGQDDTIKKILTKHLNKKNSLITILLVVFCQTCLHQYFAQLNLSRREPLPLHSFLVEDKTSFHEGVATRVKLLAISACTLAHAMTIQIVTIMPSSFSYKDDMIEIVQEW